MNEYEAMKQIEALDQKHEGRNKLHSALLEGEVEKVFEYLKLGVDATIKDAQCGRNCVGWAAKGGNLKCLYLLKEYMDDKEWKAQLQSPDNFDNLPLHLAAVNSNSRQLFEFIHREGGHTLLEIGQNNFGLFHYVFAAKKNNMAILDYLNRNLSSEEKQFLLSQRSNEGLPPLHWYIMTNNNEGIEALLNLPEIDINQPGSIYYTSALILAAQKGNLEAISLLIEKGANIHYRDIRNNTALLSALNSKHYDAANLLIQMGANINQVLTEGDTLLHLWIKNMSDKEEDIEGLKFLLTHGAERSMDKEDFYGFRPVEWLSAPVDNSLSKLTGVNPAIIEQFKNSFRYSAERINGHRAQATISKEFPAIGEEVKGGICNAYGFLGAHSFFKNGCSLDNFYQELKNFIDLGEKSSLNESEKLYFQQWVDNIVWLQTSANRQDIFKKSSTPSTMTPRYYDFFGAHDKRKTLSFISDSSIFGPYFQYSLFFQPTFDGNTWSCPELAQAIAKRCQEGQYLEIFSEQHVSVVIKKDDYYLLIDSNSLTKIAKHLTIDDIINLLMGYHYEDRNHNEYCYAGHFPFHLRSWSLLAPNKKDNNDSCTELKNEIKDHLSNNELNYYTSQHRNLALFAIAFDDVHTLKTIIENYPDFDLNTPEPSTGLTPIHYAIKHGAVRCVELLLSQPQIDLFSKDNNDFYMLAEAYQSEPMLSLVLETLAKRGLEPESLNKGNFNFRFFALAGGDMDLIKRLFTIKELEMYTPHFQHFWVTDVADAPGKKN